VAGDGLRRGSGESASLPAEVKEVLAMFVGKGVELRNLCCFDVPHLRHELRDAVKRLRRKPYWTHEREAVA
jgi:hypothetical protein